jgi:hypothetical protein
VNIAVPLVGGGSAVVDEQDVDVLRLTWELNRNGYARHRGKGIDILLHRYVMGDPPGLLVDHRDRNRLNCCRHNLRVVPPRINDFNRKPGGIRFDARRNKWQVRFGQAHVGYRDSADDAMLLAAQARVDRLGEHAPPWAVEIVTLHKERATQCECLSSLVSV